VREALQSAFKESFMSFTRVLFLCVNKEVIFRDCFLRKCSLFAEIFSLDPIQVSDKMYGENIVNLL